MRYPIRGNGEVPGGRSPPGGTILLFEIMNQFKIPAIPHIVPDREVREYLDTGHSLMGGFLKTGAIDAKALAPAEKA